MVYGRRGDDAAQGRAPGFSLHAESGAHVAIDGPVTSWQVRCTLSRSSAGDSMTGLLALVEGGVRLAYWARIGLPVSADVAGDMGMDLLDELWRYTGTVSVQMLAGTTTVWSGSGASLNGGGLLY